jgi:hypothetical protein
MLSISSRLRLPFLLPARQSHSTCHASSGRPHTDADAVKVAFNAAVGLIDLSSSKYQVSVKSGRCIGNNSGMTISIAPKRIH